MKMNRIWIGTAVILFASVFYEMQVKPQSRPLYERALTLYRQESYAAALLELERAYEIEPNSTAILALMGWNHLKLRQHNAAQNYFSRAARLDPELVEAKLGLAYVSLETGEGEVSLAAIRTLLEREPGNRDFQLAAAVALRQAGRNQEATPVFRGLLGSEGYEQVARKNLEQMFGIEDLNEEIPQGLPPLRRPRTLEVTFRASGQYLQRRSGNTWENFYVRGINLGLATPGHFISDPPTLVEDYLKWLQQIAELGANTVRAYTILPPAFYRALQRHNENPNLPRLYLLQEVWLVGPEESNLFLPAVETAARQEIVRVINLLHGQGDLPMRKGHASGLYTVDVSSYVLGLLIGPPPEPHLVLANNERNLNRNSYIGKNVSLPEGNATEVWLASMIDYAANYETVRYNQQRPLSLVNWPPLDPLTHPTEAGLRQEINFREKMGERVGGLPAVFDDNDSVSVDDTRLRAEAGFQAGLFASYHVYPYYPDFMLNDPELLGIRDHEGPNSYFGYLKVLKAHYSNMPLLIAEYGIPTSMGVSHFHPYGWNHGGLNEREQGEALARMTRNIADAGCAGGIVFEWQDEWIKSNWLTAPLEMPFDRRALWLNALNPGENFGLWTYEPSQSRLFSSDPSSWRGVNPLYQKPGAPPAVVLNDGSDGQRTLRSLAVSSDEAFLYMRLAVASLPSRPDGTPQLDQANYLIGISTRPGHFGSRILSGLVPHLRFPEGINFLLHVSEEGKAQLLVASNYNAYSFLPIEGITNRVHLGFRGPWRPVIDQWSAFEEIVVQTNRLRFSRDGTAFPAQRYSRSLLRYGPLDPSAPQYDSLASWSADFQGNALIFRLPWALLFVTDPSSRQVYAGSEGRGQLNSVTTEGFAFFAVSFRPGPSAPGWSQFPSTPLVPTDSLPAVDQNGIFIGVQKYSWNQWDIVQLSGRLKASAALLQQSFRDLEGRDF